MGPTLLYPQCGTWQPVNYRTADRFKIITFFNVKIKKKLKLDSNKS
jgi:hypothetical protein